jgi:hypothetical protein
VSLLYSTVLLASRETQNFKIAATATKSINFLSNDEAMDVEDSIASQNWDKLFKHI